RNERQPLAATLRAELGERSFRPLDHMFAGFLAPRMVPDLLTIARAWWPEVIVRDPLEFGGGIAAEMLGIPHATNGPFFALWQGAWTGQPDEFVKADFDVLRRRFGLPPDRNLAMLHKYLYLASLPPSFPHPDLVLPPTLHYVRTVGFNQ